MKRSDVFFRPIPSTAKTLVIGMVLTVLLILVLAAPLVFVLAVGASDATLTRVSNIGQAYGTVSALLSVIALCAIAGSVFYQARQDRAASAAAVRDGQRQLLGYLIAEPSVFLPCIMDYEIFRTEEEVRQYMFTTLWLGLCRQAYETEYYNELVVREEFAQTMFRSPLARDLWRTRKKALGFEGNGDMGSFFGIFEQEYRKAVEPVSTKAGPAEASDGAQANPAAHD